VVVLVVLVVEEEVPSEVLRRIYSVRKMSRRQHSNDATATTLRNGGVWYGI